MYSFLAACYTNNTASPSFDDGVQVQKVLEMAIRSDNG
jgi:hypothetical protein